MICDTFSKTPGPRYKDEGAHSGEEFRIGTLRDAVLNAITQNEVLLVDLDGTAGYGTSFLEEAFGGLIREDNVSVDQFKNHVEIKSDEEPYLVEDIQTYVEDARDE